MLNYRVQVTKVQDGSSQDWDFIDKVLVIWGTAWILKAAKEVALAYAKK